MADKIEGLKKELEELIYQGELLLGAIADDAGKLDEGNRKYLKDNKIQLPKFVREYDNWYSASLRVIKQVVPERLDDFIKQYRYDKRDSLSYSTYTIYDYLIGVAKRDKFNLSAMTKMQHQVTILKSVLQRFRSSLFDIKEVLQADIFDSELEAARELCKRGFFRAGGAMAGVVLEAHLLHVCTQHNLKAQKKKSTIGDLNELLKDSVIDTAKWRFISHLGDLRNLCDHKREREPNRDDVNDLIEGVEKIIKTVS